MGVIQGSINQAIQTGALALGGAKHLREQALANKQAVTKEIMNVESEIPPIEDALRNNEVEIGENKNQLSTLGISSKEGQALSNSLITLSAKQEVLNKQKNMFQERLKYLKRGVK